MARVQRVFISSGEFPETRAPFFGEGSGEDSRKPWYKAKSGSTGSIYKVPEKAWEALVQSRFGEVPKKVWEVLVRRQIRFNRVPEKFLEKVPGGFVQSQVRFNRVPEKVPEKVWEALEQAEIFPALGFAAHFRNIYKY